MSKERLYLFDTTLRDGAQTNGIDFTLEDKVLIAGLLDELGIDYVEGGYPGANPTDTAFFEAKRTRRAAFTAFGMTKRAGVSVSNDPGLRALIDGAGRRHLLRRQDLGLSRPRRARRHRGGEPRRHPPVGDRGAARRARRCCSTPSTSSTATRPIPTTPSPVRKAAYEAGARWVVLCDTNGGTLPEEVEAIVAEVAKVVPGDHLGIHAHNDTEQAVANSLAAVRAGARQVQGTLNGIGERCGNASLTSLIPTLLLKPAYAERFETGVTMDGLAGLTALAHRFDELLNRAPNRQAPYVGASAFTTKAGIHASAIAKDPKTYEHVVPETVGNRRHVLVSDQAGKANLLAELARMGIEVEKDDQRLDTLLREVKEREAVGYSYEGASASFELLARRVLGGVRRLFRGGRLPRHASSAATTPLGKLVTVSEAVVKTRIGGERVLTVAEGNGPVNALDRALAQGPRRLSQRHRRPRAGRLQGAYPQRRHRGGDPRAHRIERCLRRLVVHRRRVGERRRCLLRGALRFGGLQAAQGGRRAGLSCSHQPGAVAGFQLRLRRAGEFRPDGRDDLVDRVDEGHRQGDCGCRRRPC